MYPVTGNCKRRKESNKCKTKVNEQIPKIQPPKYIEIIPSDVHDTKHPTRLSFKLFKGLSISSLSFYNVPDENNSSFILFY